MGSALAAAIDERAIVHGRYGQLSAETAQTIVESIARGMSRKGAAALAGIAFSTFNRWVERGTKELDDISSPFGLLVQAIDMAEAEVESELVTHFVDEAKEDWRANSEFLARRFPDRWGKAAERDTSTVVNFQINMGKKLHGDELTDGS